MSLMCDDVNNIFVCKCMKCGVMRICDDVNNNFVCKCMKCVRDVNM